MLKKWNRSEFGHASLLVGDLHPNTQYQLFCCGYAGSHAGIYFSWLEYMPENIQICATELPGRASRSGDALLSEMSHIIDDILPDVAEYIILHKKPFGFFGHSMGALIAYELISQLGIQYGIFAECLFVSAAMHPDHKVIKPLYILNDEDLLNALKERSGIKNTQIFSPPDLEYIINILRADIQAYETYQSESKKVNCPIAAFFGLNDYYVNVNEMKKWEEYTEKKFTITPFPGGHLFLENNAQNIIFQIQNTFRSIQHEQN